MFCDTNGGWLRKSNVQRRHFTPLLKRAGLRPLRFHDLRHSSAPLLLLAGEDVRVVSARLGHNATSTTQQTYQHVIEGMDRRAADRMDRVFRKAAGE